MLVFYARCSTCLTQRAAHTDTPMDIHTHTLMIYVAAVRGPHWFVMLTERTISVSVGVSAQETQGQ